VGSGYVFAIPLFAIRVTFVLVMLPLLRSPDDDDELLFC
jgi:hypothetical protein